MLGDVVLFFIFLTGNIGDTIMKSPIEKEFNDDKRTFPARGEGNQIPEKCSHIWVSNSGKGGEAVFKRAPFSKLFATHVKCSKCNNKCWKTRGQLEAIILYRYSTSYDKIVSGMKKETESGLGKLKKNESNAGTIRQCLGNINVNINKLISDSHINCPYSLHLLCEIKKSIVVAENTAYLIKDL